MSDELRMDAYMIDHRPLHGPPTWHFCEACNYGLHRCHFCGDDIDHSVDIYPSQRVDRNPCYENESWR